MSATQDHLYPDKGDTPGYLHELIIRFVRNNSSYQLTVTFQGLQVLYSNWVKAGNDIWEFAHQAVAGDKVYLGPDDTPFVVTSADMVLTNGLHHMVTTDETYANTVAATL